MLLLGDPGDVFPECLIAIFLRRLGDEENGAGHKFAARTKGLPKKAFHPVAPHALSVLFSDAYGHFYPFPVGQVDKEKRGRIHAFAAVQRRLYLLCFLEAEIAHGKVKRRCAFCPCCDGS